jgi:hypothetical protein
LNSKDQNLFSGNAQKGGSTTSRPLLLIVDRNIDLLSMLRHGWTYQSLVSDVLENHLQQYVILHVKIWLYSETCSRIKVTIPAEEGSTAKPVTKQYDLKANDFFWAANSSAPFPSVAENIDKDLTSYREEATEVTRKAGVSSLDELNPDAGASAAQLRTAITLLPELRERKATLDMVGLHCQPLPVN